MEAILESPVYTPNSPRSVNFFNGRLLSAEDMTKEREAVRALHRQLGRALGSGIAFGLEVEATAPTANPPRLRIRPGLAVDHQGALHEVLEPVELTVKRPTAGSGAGPATTGMGFVACVPPQAGVYFTNAGLYLLTMAAAEVNEGRTPVSGLGNSVAVCNVRFNIAATQFFLRDLTSTFLDLVKAIPATNNTDAIRKQVNLLRNQGAHACFGSADPQRLAWLSNPFNATAASYGLLDDLRDQHVLSACEVPLALLYWSSSGIEFVDCWSVRRRVSQVNSAVAWTTTLADRRAAEVEAMLWQFQTQLAQHPANTAAGLAAAADLGFATLPPAGFLPDAGNSPNWRQFLGKHGPSDETPIAGGALEAVLHQALATEPFLFAREPLAAVDVYRVPGAPYVLFARSLAARLHIVLSPAPGDRQAVAATVKQMANDQVVAARASDPGSRLLVADLAAGPCTIAFEVTGFVQPADQEVITAVGGEIMELSVTLEPLTNGSIVLVPTNLQGVAIAAQISSVTCTSADSSRVFSGSLAADGSGWVITDVPAGTYTVSVVAAAYNNGTLPGVVVKPGETARAVIVLTPLPQQPNIPESCISFKIKEIPGLNIVQICMLADSVAFSGEAAYSLYFNQYLVPFDNGSATGLIYGFEEAKSKWYRKWVDQPWLEFTQVVDVPVGVVKWLAAWQAWFAGQYPGQGIEQATPVIFCRATFTPYTDWLGVAPSPEAYVVFGSLSVPLAVTPDSYRTIKPVELEESKIWGLPEEVRKLLRDSGIVYIDQLAGTPVDIIQRIINQPEPYVRYLIDDARQAAIRINQDRTYLDGVTPEIKEKLPGDDIGLANADPVVLGKEIGSQGLAYRLISQAQQITPENSWSLSALGFNTGQLAQLDKAGISSQGQLVAQLQTPEGAGSVAGVLGIQDKPVEEQQKFFDGLRGTSESLRLKGSIDSAKQPELTAIPGVSASVAAVLAAAGIDSSVALATADASVVAGATGMSPDLAQVLVESAAAGSVTAKPITSISTITGAEAATLKANGIETLGDLAKNMTALNAIMGADTVRTEAIMDTMNSLNLIKP